jgi:carbonic anhydrase
MLLIGLLGALSGGCEKVRAVVCEPTKSDDGAAGAAGSAPGAAAKALAGSAAPSANEPSEPKGHEAGDAHGPETLTSTAKFALPFAWEKSPTEPLARARLFLRELADDNDAYMKKGPEFFKTLVAGETPRATILTCSDSRVQPGALDASPENDDYTIRNLGNQLEIDLGSVQYGIEELHTPVLLVLGHTGCTAVKAALGDSSQLSDRIRHEIARIKVKKTKPGADDKRWLGAVLENVHDQVRVALKQFGARVNAGELTIVGAVYDFRNDMGRGPGRLTVINVNGNQDEERLKAFGDAIMSTANPNGGGRSARESALDRLAKVLAEHGSVGPDEEDEEEPAPVLTPQQSAAKTKPAHLAH